MRVYLNRVETSNPRYEGHSKFVSFLPYLIGDERKARIVAKLASKSQIDTRYTVMQPAPEADLLDADGFFRIGQFASTAKRMQRYQEEALPLASRACAQLFAAGVAASEITHLIVTSCTGFYAPGLDLELQKEFGMRSDLERSVIGFMGCYAGFNAMKSAWHIVRSQPEAKVLIVNLELCSLHLQQDEDIEKILGFLQFADGCAASLVSAKPVGLELESFKNQVFDEGSELICWHIGDQGFKMVLSMDLPGTLGRALPDIMPKLMSGEERAATQLWAVHPGGRSILDAVQARLELTDLELLPSREVLRNFGNMSSATIMFVLKSLMEGPDDGPGFAMAFGPGLTVESMRFKKGRS